MPPARHTSRRIARAAMWLGLSLSLATAGIAAESTSDATEPPPNVPIAEPEPEETPDEEQAREESLAHELEEWVPEEEPVERWRLLHPRQWHFEWRQGLRLRREDGLHELMFGGRLQADAGLAHLDDGLEHASPPGWRTEAELRQARLFVQGILFRKLTFKVSYELSDTEIRDIYLGVRKLGPIHSLRVGFQEEPFSLEQKTSSRARSFMEPSLANALVPRRNSGILASGNIWNARLRWAVGTFVVVDSFQEDDNLTKGFDGDWDLTFRLTGLPIYRKEGAQLLLAGLSFNHRFADDKGVSFSSRPETGLIEGLIRTPVITDLDQMNTLGLELAWVDGPFTLQGEWIRSNLSRSGGQEDLVFSGGYIQTSWFPTGDRRAYGRRSGVFGRVVPNAPFSWGGAGRGAIELAARLSFLDLDDGPIRGGRQLDTTLGASWYLNTQLRLTLEWVHAHISGEGNADVLQTRVQIDF
ncbi:MAG: hypothetical protein JRG95_19925 [Deltaproteobacteria bacterium]|nr:hypothetical protein [Deltaproteobacteria bacterium]